MPSRCCVPHCSNRGGFRLPSEKEVNKKWIVAIQRDKWTPVKSSVVCGDHFKMDDFKAVTFHGTEREKKRLKPTAVPSVFTWTKPPSSASQRRTDRAGKRIEYRDQEPQFEQSNDINMYEEVVDYGDAECLSVLCESVPSCVSSTQTPTVNSRLNIEGLVGDNHALHYYTGLIDYSSFSYVLQTLGPGAHRLNYRWGTPQNISVENQFLLTLIKLRLHAPNRELSILFSVSENAVSNIFVTWVNFMYCKWQKLNIWPNKDLVQFYNPDDFKRLYPTTRVILDGMEIPIKKTKKPKAQQVTYSTYKNRNTLKIVVGVTPGGLTSHIPPSYGGSASDRMLVERSDLLDKCDPKDSLMVDKGFNIQDIFAPKDITVNIPTFLKKRNQLTTRAIVNDRKIASKRVHVERIIGLAKTYKILATPLNDIETIMGSRIIFVCFMLCNFRPCIVPTTA